MLCIQKKVRETFYRNYFELCYKKKAKMGQTLTGRERELKEDAQNHCFLFNDGGMVPKQKAADRTGGRHKHDVGGRSDTRHQ